MRITKLLSLVVFGLLLSGCFNRQQYGAVSINSSQVSTVQIDGKDVGSTPFKEDKILAGQTTIRLVPQDSNLKSWEESVDINPGARTLITRELSQIAEKQSGEILSMEKTGQSVASVTVVSNPDGSMVKLDGEALGPTPLEKSQISEGEHEMVISAPGYVERVVRFKSQNGYKVLVDVDLSKVDLPIVMEPEQSTESAESTASASPTPSTSATNKLSITPTLTKTSPTPTKKPLTTTSDKSVKILTTPTGWLRVRADASVNSEEVGKVNPGEVYPLLDESEGWYQIDLGDNKKGWIAGQYAQKQ